MPKFNEDENRKIDKVLRGTTNEMMKKIKECEENIKLMSLMKDINQREKLVRDNMKTNLVNKLSDFTRKFKLNEEEYIQKYKELVGDDVMVSSNTNESIPIDKSNSKDDFLKLESPNDVLRKRDNEINNLLSSIDELACIYKDFQILVLEQGTILDRIDYNIDSTCRNITQGHVELKKAEKNMESGCARNVNLVLILFIFILSVLLIFKFVK